MEVYVSMDIYSLEHLTGVQKTQVRYPSWISMSYLLAYNTFGADLLWVLLNYLLHIVPSLLRKSTDSLIILKLSNCLLHSHVW